jgi:hypothetical protein
MVMTRRGGDTKGRTGVEPKQGRRPDAHRKPRAPEDSPRGGVVRDVTFEIELEAYREHLPELLEAEGKFVLIRDRAVGGPFDTYADALEAGYSKYGLESFLVKQIRSAEPIQYFARDLR